MKKYKLSWFSPLDGSNSAFDYEISTTNPKEELFNYACKMICTISNWFEGLKCDNIKKNIKTGNHNHIRESYYIEFANDQFLFCIECLNDTKRKQTQQARTAPTR